MKDDEFAFFNRQLAGMLRNGITLEGGLEQLSATMLASPLRTEIEQLRGDLSRGMSLKDALPLRKLPELYRQLVQVGAQSNDLPAILTMVADYYQQRHLLWSRLKGLLVYPAIVLVVSIGLVGFCVWTLHSVVQIVAGDMLGHLVGTALPAALWLPVVVLVIALIAFLSALGVPRCRDWLRWRLPGFRESSLYQVAMTMHLLLRGGARISESLELVQSLEPTSEIGLEVGRWRAAMAEGYGKLPQFAAGSRLFPRLFLWLVGQSGEDLAGGFARAGEIYYQRAQYRVEMLLYAALPVAVVAVGALVLFQFVFLTQSVLVPFLNALGEP